MNEQTHEHELELEPKPEPLYVAGGHEFDRTFTDAQITAHFRKVLELMEELDPPAELAGKVYDGVNAMVSDVQPRESGTLSAATPQEVALLNRADRRRRHGK